MAVLVPAVPLLLLSVTALAMFFSAPTRFNAWLSRLPGDDLLRTALIFAPATLMAIIVMAVLYANDAPKREAVEATRPSPRPRLMRARPRGGVARATLWLTVPALMLVATAQVVAFIAPGRVDRLLQALPATGLLTRLFDLSPYVVLAAVGVGLLLGFMPSRPAEAEPPRGGRGWTTPRIARLGALLILVPSLGLLIVSGAGLVWVSTSADRLAWLANRLPGETLLRLGLMFFPAMMLGLILLAGMYLVGPGRPEMVVSVTSGEAREGEPRRGASASTGLRSGLAVGVLIAGLGFTALAGMAVLLSVIFVLAG